jgi:mRNA deadenylase 3'-5' endonuclease subunit Ccr4
LVPRPKEKKLIGVKLIYKEKKKVKREEERYKTRLEEKSYSQK